MSPEVRGECPNCNEPYTFQVPFDMMQRFFTCPRCSTDLTSEEGLPLGWQEHTKDQGTAGAKVEVTKTKTVKSPEEGMQRIAEAQSAVAKAMMAQEKSIMMNFTMSVRSLGSLNLAKRCQPEQRFDTARDLIEFGIELDAWVAKRLPPPKLPEFKPTGIAYAQKVPSRSHPQDACADPNCPGGSELTQEEQDRIAAEVQAESVRKFEEHREREKAKSDSGRNTIG